MVAKKKKSPTESWIKLVNVINEYALQQGSGAYTVVDIVGMVDHIYNIFSEWREYKKEKPVQEQLPVLVKELEKDGSIKGMKEIIRVSYHPEHYKYWREIL